MKSTILNLIATATLLFGWTVYAADETVQKTQPAAMQPAAVTPAASAETTSVLTPPATTQETQPPVKRSKMHKRAKRTLGRSHDLDLRHCLELPTNVEIAKCAGE